MKILEILSDYINQENTDFAILIDGSWGSGKTYFIKNEFQSIIEKSKCTVEGREEQYSLVYVSLYGLSSVDELQKRLFLEVNPLMKTKAAKVGKLLLGKVSNIFSVGIDEDDEKSLLNIFGGITKQKVLAFDDLERLSNDILNEVLGFINSYTEHQGLKVIIIADEAKIKDKITDYEKVKEKLIRFTFSYKPKLEEVLPEFVKLHDNKKFEKLILSQKKLLCQTFEKGNHHNLRTLRFILDLYLSIFQKVECINDIEESNKNSILILFLYFLLTYSIEYKKGVSKEWLQSLKALGEHLEAGGFGINTTKNLLKRSNSQSAENAPSLNEVENFLSHFEVNYIENSTVKFKYYGFIAKFIHTGSLDLQSLKNACLEFNASAEALKEMPHYTYLNSLENCTLLDDDKFIEVVTSVLSFVDQGKYKLKEYQKIFEILINCQTNQVEGIVVDDALVNRFKEGMKKSLSNSKYRPDIRSARHFSDAPEKLKEIRTYTIELNSSLLDNEIKKDAIKAFELVKAHKMEEFDSYIMQEDVQGVPIFQEKFITPEEFVATFFNLTNKEKKHLQQSFSTFFYPYLDIVAFNAMQPFLKKIKHLIEDKIQKMGSESYPLSIINARDFIFTIDVVITRENE